MKVASSEQLEQALAAAAAEFDVRVPVALEDGTRTLGRLGAAPLALSGGPLPGKPTAVFFPQREAQWVYQSGGFEALPRLEKPLFVLGLSAADARCLKFIDRFFTQQFADDLYLRRRRGSVVGVISGRCGPQGECQAMAGGDCDFELVADGTGRFAALAYTPPGERFCAGLPETDSFPLRAIEEECRQAVAEFDKLIRRAAAILAADQVSEDFWQEIADRCINCMACNLVCPTCTCFDVYDWKCGPAVERQRLWDSCQLGGFMREASGHNPLGTEGARTRRRIHHKLVADPQRWGLITCFLCGRCDRACPTGIGIEAVCRKMVERFG